LLNVASADAHVGASTSSTAMAALAEVDAVLMPEHLSPDISATRRTRPAAERELLPIELVVRLDQPLAAATEHLEWP
jgi:hypothetical protein